MYVLTIELFEFDELSEDAKLLALRCGTEENIKENRYRFYANGVFFDALGLEETGNK